MQISLELSLYPLDADYGPPILDFIERLRSYDEIEVVSNKMSTQVFGDYDRVWSIVQREMRTAFTQNETSIMVIKCVNQKL